MYIGANFNQNNLPELYHICDWIYRNRSKSHIGSYEIIDFKDFKAL